MRVYSFLLRLCTYGLVILGCISQGVAAVSTTIILDNTACGNGTTIYATTAVLGSSCSGAFGTLCSAPAHGTCQNTLGTPDATGYQVTTWCNGVFICFAADGGTHTITTSSGCVPSQQQNLTTNYVQCITWTNHLAKWALLDITIGGDASGGQNITSSEPGGYAVAPGAVFSRCFTNSGTTANGQSWCDPNNNSEFGAAVYNARAKDASEVQLVNYNVTRCWVTTNNPVVTNMVVSPKTNSPGDIYDYLGTNYNTITKGTNNATSADINQLANVEVQIAAQLANSIDNLNKRLTGDGQGTPGTNGQVGLVVSGNITLGGESEIALGAIQTNTAGIPSISSNVALMTTNLGVIYTNSAKTASNTAALVTNSIAGNNLLASIATNGTGSGTSDSSNLLTFGAGASGHAYATNWIANGLGTNGINQYLGGTNLQGAAVAAGKGFGTNLNGTGLDISGSGDGSGTNGGGGSGLTGEGSGPGGPGNSYAAISSIAVSPEEDWGVLHLGFFGVTQDLDVKQILSLSFLDTGGHALIAVGGVRGGLRLFLLWACIVLAVKMLWEDLTKSLTEALTVPATPNATILLFGTTVPLANETYRVIQTAALLAALALFPTIIIAVAETALAYVGGDYTSVAGLTAAVSNGGLWHFMGVNANLGKVFYLINQWFPLVEDFILALNMAVAGFVLNTNRVLNAITAKLL